MAPSTYTRVVLNKRPPEHILPGTFRQEKLKFSDLKVGKTQILVQVTWLSLDPAMRGFIRDVRSYLPPVKIGEVMRGSGLGVVLQAGSGSKFKVGDKVHGPFGWTEYAVVNDKGVDLVEPPLGSQTLDFLNTLGLPGLTAYFGLKDVGELKAGETLVVSGAAGAVGSLVCQLGIKAGAKVFAIAGSDAKCQWLEKDIGVHKAFNYKSPQFRQDIKSIGYLDVYFDNVGGDILDMLLTRLNKNARIVMCGAISEYNSAKPKGLSSYMTLISQRAKMQGFIVFDYEPQYQVAIKEMSQWLGDGSLKRKFHIVEGIEKAPEALPMLFNGGNTGKLVVKISDESKAKL